MLTVEETRASCGVELSIVPPDPLSIVDPDPCQLSNGCPHSKEINRRPRRTLSRHLMWKREIGLSRSDKAKFADLQPSQCSVKRE